jgi:hypothetical protein
LPAFLEPVTDAQRCADDEAADDELPAVEVEVGCDDQADACADGEDPIRANR